MLGFSLFESSNPGNPWKVVGQELLSSFAGPSDDASFGWGAESEI